MMKSTVQDIMQKNVLTIEPHKSLAELETILLDANISGLPVVEGGQLVGMVSRSDIVRHLRLERDLAIADIGLPASSHLTRDDALDVGYFMGKRLEEIRVKDVMNRRVDFASPDQSIREVADLMVSKGIHRLPVVLKDHLVGQVTGLDIVRLVAEGEFENRENAPN